jgi:hypothetical protein
MTQEQQDVYIEWSDAHTDTESAWLAWRAERTLATYAVYRAAADREDCAQERLAAQFAHAA